jgi:hypothetical protein
MRYEVNVATGEIINREATADELAQEAIDQAASAAAQAEQDAAENARIAAKESARAKMAALGLTDEEISAIVGG